MLVAEVMSRNIEVAEPKTLIRSLAQTMRDKDIGAIPVVENDRMIGMVTDRDIVMRGVAKDLSPREGTARDVMSGGIAYCYDEDSVEDVAKKMARPSGQSFRMTCCAGVQPSRPSPDCGVAQQINASSSLM